MAACRYVWDSNLRKFMPEGDAAAAAGAGGAAPAAPAPAPHYNEEDMVFVPDEEKQPEYEPPPKVGVAGDRSGVAPCWAQRGGLRLGSPSFGPTEGLSSRAAWHAVTWHAQAAMPLVMPPAAVRRPARR